MWGHVAKQWLTWINLGIGGIAVLLLIGALMYTAARPSEIVIVDPALAKRSLPPGAFAMPKQACDAIGVCGLNLKFSPITLQIPDFRNVLIYYGKNGRPDAMHERAVLHFAFTTNPTNTTTVLSGERLYILYDRKRTPPQYIFSPDNAETPLWIEPTAQGNEAIVKVGMRNENGELITEPESNMVFNLVEKELAKANAAGKVWDIGKWRVDGSLLARQKARWIGSDRFIEKHGGHEYQILQGKQRIDFSDEERSYSIYVGANDNLIWENDQWKITEPGSDSLAYPLLVVKKIDERLINFELWDVGGKNKVILNLVKTNETWNPQSIQATFKFLGARTRSQYIFEINNQRMLLSPKDWLLQTPDGWIKLTTAKQIDDYVDRKLIGVLFVCEGLTTKEGKQVLNGFLFSSSRTEIAEIELPVLQGSTVKVEGVKKSPDKKGVKPQQDEDEDDDEEDDQDDE